jgi:hypothetical protein
LTPKNECLAVTLALAYDQGVNAQTNFRVLSDIGGRITAVVLQLARPELTRALLDIAAALPHARVLVAVPDDSVEVADEHLEVLPRVPEIGLWPRDAFIGGEGLQLLVTSDLHGGEADRAVAYRVADAVSAQLTVSRLYFEGGNMVADDQQVFAGWDVLSDNTDDWSPDALDATLAVVEEQLGRPVVIVGSEDHPAPLDHVDMFLTPLGDNRILVADPLAGARLLVALPPARIVALETHFLDPAASGYPGTPFSLLEALESSADAERVAAFEHVAEGLRGRGFVVHRIPALIADDDADCPIFTYNNVLMERAGEGPRVLVPAYGIAELDAAAVGVWRELGFDVGVIDLSQLLDLHGGVRCLTQVVGRDW